MWGGRPARAASAPGGETHATHILNVMYRTLEYLRGISAADVRRLRAIGIHHTNQLPHRTPLEIDRRRLAKRARNTPDRRLRVAHQRPPLTQPRNPRHPHTTRP